MKKIIFAVVTYLCFCSISHADETVFYARCNIRITDSMFIRPISYNNFMSSPVGIFIGEQVRLFRNGKTWFVAKQDGVSYELPSNETRDKYLVPEPVAVTDFADDIKKAQIKPGMTKEQVFAALCAPREIHGGLMGEQSTEKLTVSDIMAQHKWIYHVRLINDKKIFVEFDDEGRVVRINREE